MDGCAVRLVQGRRDQKTVYSEAPWEIADAWGRGGADRIHLVDLDAAFDGSSRNGEAVRRMVRATDCPTELGGGIRTVDDAARALEEWGVGRVIAGTAAARDPTTVEAMLDRFGPERVIVGIDARDGIAKVSGWVEGEGLRADDLGRAMRALGILTCVFTDIAKDGMLQGPNLAATAAFADATDLATIVSGGISGLDDLRAILDLAHPGIEGVIVGKALVRRSVRGPRGRRDPARSRDVNASLRANLLPDVRRVVVKVGTRLLTHEGGGLAPAQLERVVDQIVALRSGATGRWCW
jgi:phosphoribosylformimino-5-aminoimidazole carboxamide ribotide isomerase